MYKDMCILMYIQYLYIDLNCIFEYFFETEKQPGFFGWLYILSSATFYGFQSVLLYEVYNKKTQFYFLIT